MVGRAVRGSLDPLRRAADSHTRQGMVLMCPSEELAVSFRGSHCRAGGGVRVGGRMGVGVGGKSASWSPSSVIQWRPWKLL